MLVLYVDHHVRLEACHWEIRLRCLANGASRVQTLSNLRSRCRYVVAATYSYRINNLTIVPSVNQEQSLGRITDNVEASARRSYERVRTWIPGRNEKGRRRFEGHPASDARTEAPPPPYNNFAISE